MTTVSAPPRVWQSLHVHLDRPRDEVDRYLTGELAGALAEPLAGRAIADWFFIRYGEGGHHLRLRLRDAQTEAVVALEARLARELSSERGEMIRRSTYEPERERYGGERGLPIAEDVFAASSRVALDLLADIAGPEQRLAAGLDLTMATSAALGVDMQVALRWLRINAFSWRWHPGAGTAPAAGLLRSATTAAPARAAAIMRRWSAIRAGALPPGNPVGHWLQVVREARSTLETSGPLPWLGVWGSQLHMLCNRVGLVPDEERWISWFLTECVLQADADEPYFDASPTAADRHYLAASRYAGADMDARQPRELPRVRPLVAANPFGPDEAALPEPSRPTASLADALAERTSARGRIGPLDCAGLSTLLWTALAPVPSAPVIRWGDRPEEVWQRRPHPSAGAQYTVRTRLIARRVDGLGPGLYDVDEQRRRLVRLTDAPTARELVAASMWFRDAPPYADRVDADRVPAVIALWLDLANLRARYGQRALRFGLLEAGHVAQDLALVAAATGLALSSIGGFYDDVTAELLMLDGLDDVPVYLLPVGGRIGNPTDPQGASAARQLTQGGH